MAGNKNHDYHIIDPSPWPLLGSIGALVMALGGIGYMRYLNDAGASLKGLSFLTGPWIFYIGLAIVLFTMIGWWAATIKEAHEGHHTRVVSLHLRYGMIMFIASEVMFFVAWFWAFFDAALYPAEGVQEARTAYTGGVWPPTSVEVLDHTGAQVRAHAPVSIVERQGGPKGLEVGHHAGRKGFEPHGRLFVLLCLSGIET